MEKEPVREDKGKGKAAMYEEEEEYEVLSQVLELLALLVQKYQNWRGGGGV